MTWNLTSAQLVATFAGAFFAGYLTRRTVRMFQRLTGAWFE